jgi:hypothetical protein
MAAMSFILFGIHVPTTYYARSTSERSTNSSPTPTKTFNLMSRLDPLSRIRRFKAKRNARDYLDENVRNCSFYQLPQELVDMITQHLSTSDMLSLAASCRLRLTPPVHVVCRNKKEFAFRFQRDRRNRMITAEQCVDPARRKKLFCNLCVERHPPSDFTASQISAAAQSRKCIAASLVFPVCQHLRLTFGRLRELSRNPTDSWRDYPCCHHKDHCHWEQPKLDSPWPRNQRSSGIYTFLVLSTLTPDQPIQASHVSGVLREKDAFICPHLRTSSPLVFQILMASRQTNPEFDNTEDFFAGSNRDAMT